MKESRVKLGVKVMDPNVGEGIDLFPSLFASSSSSCELARATTGQKDETATIHRAFIVLTLFSLLYVMDSPRCLTLLVLKSLFKMENFR